MTSAGNEHAQTLRLGAWARTGDFTGVVAAVDDETVTLFDPGDRRVAQASRTDVVAVDSAALTVSLRVDLPVPHGLSEKTLMRWLASLAEPGVRARARNALTESDIDEAVMLPDVRVDVEPVSTSGAVCLCGARTPAPDGADVACARCGRHAVTRPPRSGGGDVLGIHQA